MIKKEDSKISVSFIADTHNNHNDITKDLLGGDLIIMAGDIHRKNHPVNNALIDFI